MFLHEAVLTYLSLKKWLCEVDYPIKSGCMSWPVPLNLLRELNYPIKSGCMSWPVPLNLQREPNCVKQAGSVHMLTWPRQVNTWRLSSRHFFQRRNSWTAFLVEVSEHKLESFQTLVFLFSVLVFSSAKCYSEIVSRSFLFSQILFNEFFCKICIWRDCETWVCCKIDVQEFLLRIPTACHL